jgi:hypothetical protein
MVTYRNLWVKRFGMAYQHAGSELPVLADSIFSFHLRHSILCYDVCHKYCTTFSLNRKWGIRLFFTPPPRPSGALIYNIVSALPHFP